MIPTDISFLKRLGIGPILAIKRRVMKMIDQAVDQLVRESGDEGAKLFEILDSTPEQFWEVYEWIKRASDGIDKHFEENR